MPHHPPDYDDFGSQGSTDSEDGHETEAEDHKVDAEDDFTRIEQLSRQPEIEENWWFIDNPAFKGALSWPKVTVWKEGNLPKCKANDKDEDGQNI